MEMFEVTFAPYTCSPVIRKMHTHSKRVQAETEKQIREAFKTEPNWYVVDVKRLAANP